MFIETLKNFVITLVTILIFISAVELIAPSNKMKKYIQFILGLILVTVILNPIIQFISSGEKSVADGIQGYKMVFSQNKVNDNSTTSDFENDKDKVDGKKKSFMKNFNKNCDNLLKNKYKEKTFETEIDCDVDFVNITFNVKKLKIGVGENKINKIKKVVINKEVETISKEENTEYMEIVKFVSSELNIPEEKIEVYKINE